MNERDDERLTDYLEGRLDADARAQLEERMVGDAVLARRLRLLRALKASLAAAVPPAPADLKADLKRLARARDRAPRVSWWSGLSEALSGRSWAYGAGAAFAAAGVALVLRAHLPAPSATEPVAKLPPAATAPAEGATALSELWADDDGGDDDRI